MGKVLGSYTNGFPGTPSRTADEIIITIQNGSSNVIPFGAPVFLKTDGGAEGFDIDYPQSMDEFLGFAVRVPDKTPDTAVTGQNQANPLGGWRAGETMEVLVRGAVTVTMGEAANRGSQVFLRKSDGKLMATPGSSGSSFELTNVRLRNSGDTSGNCAEVIVNKRNII